MPTLSTYINETRQLLHDANARFWSNADLTGYVNEARRQVACDTHCLRTLDTTVQLTTGNETYTFSTFTTKGERAIDLLNLTVIWGQQRVPMLWAAWTDFNAKYRVWVSNQTRPTVWTFQGSAPMATLFVQPVPDQDYAAEADVAYIPLDLVDDSTVDELVWPFSKPVAFYAAYLAKYKEQGYGEASAFLQEYARKGIEAINSYTRRLPNQYT